MLNSIIRYFLDKPLVTFIIALLFIGWGLVTAPFGWDIGFLPSDPVSVDAIPNIGDNQQIVYTEWKGRSPQDVEDQITYPLTTSLLGIPGVKSIRSSSIFGVSNIYIIFKDEVDFYWSRSRILEKLNALPTGALPEEAHPTLGPDATALGQVYWYTLEGRDSTGNPTGGWDLHEIRTVQDYLIKYGLNAVDGVSEVASIGGHVQEYQIDVDPAAMKAYGIPLQKVTQAVRKSNRDVGAGTIEINRAEYLVRGLGYVKSIEDLEKVVVTVNDNLPIRIKDIGVVSLGPANRRGLLDKEGAEVVGGVVIARFGSNPMAVINNLKEKITEISRGLPKKTLANGIESQLTIVPFYDRTQLIHETLGTLEEALSLEMLITFLVVIVMVFNLRASLLIAGLLPIGVLMVFIAMRYFEVEANIVALSGIAIAIGTMVDLGIVLVENILKHIKEAPIGTALKETVYKASAEVSSAILTTVATTIVSFVPVFTLEAAEGKLFGPLAWTKTFALIAALLVSLLLLPSMARWLFSSKIKKGFLEKLLYGLLVIIGVLVTIWLSHWAGLTLLALGLAGWLPYFGLGRFWFVRNATVVISVFSVTWLMATYWMPLGVGPSTLLNFTFVALLIGLILGFFFLLEHFYTAILGFCLTYKGLFLVLPAILMYLGYSIWQQTGKEFMPSLNEGSFLLMPTSMPHAGMEQNKRVVQQLDMLLANVPEVTLAVGKMGRAETALDPAPISMYENIINYSPEYALNEKGKRQRFQVDDKERFMLTTGDTLSNAKALEAGVSINRLIPDEQGRFFRRWRKHIRSPEDIWKEIVRVTQIPGVTSAPKLQPIETRLIMLQTGMRAPMGIKIYGPDLMTIEAFGRELEILLKEVPSVNSESVFADRIVGKPYIHLSIARDEISRYGLSVEDVQQTIEVAIGGLPLTTIVEGRERFPVRVRYPRELRDNPDALSRILISTSTGAQVPLEDVVDISYVKGPQMIKSENTFPVGYVLLEKKAGYAEVDVVEEAEAFIQSKIDSGKLLVPKGVSYRFSGSYENQVRSEKRLAIIVPMVLVIIFLILYLQFKSITTTLMIFVGIAVAFAGGFILIWLYDQEWFMDVHLYGIHMRELFRIHPINLSVAVWVGFVALFGIATDDGVLMGTYLDNSFKKNTITSLQEVREIVIIAGKRRIKPAVMTSATTIIALLPVLTATGRGADIMIPMALPVFGGMMMASITYFIVPVLYAMREERRWGN